MEVASALELLVNQTIVLHRNSPIQSLGQEKKVVCFLYLTVRKNRVGRSVKSSFFALFLWSKMCVLCMFYMDWELGGWKNFRGRDFFE